MARKGRNIYKRKDGRWEARYIISRDQNGKAIYRSVYGDSYLRAKEKLEEVLKSSAAYRPKKKGTASTVGDFCSEWLSTVRVNCKRSTFVKYENSCNKYILPKFGKMNVSSITTTAAEEFLLSLISENGLSPKTVRDILSIMKLILSYADKHGGIVNCNLSAVTIKCEPTDFYVFTKEEQHILIEYILNEPDLRKIGILLCLYTGLRVGEVCALTWADIDLDAKLLYVNKTMQRIRNTDDPEPKNKTIVTVTSPKSRASVRYVPLTDFLADILREYKKENDAYFLTGMSKIYIEPRNMQHFFEICLKETGITKANFHSLRHTFATKCVEAGFEIKTLSEILGHSSVNITLNRYVHTSMEMKRLNMNKLTLE